MLEVWTITIMTKVPPLSKADHLCKKSEDVYGGERDEGWLREVELHGGFPTVSSPHPNTLTTSIIVVSLMKQLNMFIKIVYSIVNFFMCSIIGTLLPRMTLRGIDL
jgi:hypothetical protein